LQCRLCFNFGKIFSFNFDLKILVTALQTSVDNFTVHANDIASTDLMVILTRGGGRFRKVVRHSGIDSEHLEHEFIMEFWGLWSRNNLIFDT